MSAPTLTRLRVEPAGQNLKLLEPHSVLHDKVGGGTERHSTALDSPVGLLSVHHDTTRSSRRHSNELSLVITIPPAVTDRRNKISSVVGRLKVDPLHLKYLNSLNNSRWVTQCLNGEKCIQETEAKKISRNNQVSEHTSLNNMMVKDTNGSGSSLERIPLTKSRGELSTIPKHDSPQSFDAGDNSEDNLNSNETRVGNVPYVDFSSLNKTNQTIFVDNTPLNKEPNHVNQKYSSTEFSTNSGINMFPVNLSGDKSLVVKIPIPAKDDMQILPIPKEDYQLPEKFRAKTSNAHVEESVKMPQGKNEGSQKIAEGEISLPISINVQPLIHNHYYTRREAKSAQNISEELAIPDNEFSTLGSRVNRNIMTTENEMKSSKLMNRRDPPAPPDYVDWAAMENLATGDLATRFSTGKRQSEGNTILEPETQSEVETEIQSTPYPEESETLPLNTHANSNIFLILGGQWLLNLEDHDQEILKKKLKTMNIQKSFPQNQWHPSPINERLEHEAEGIHLSRQSSARIPNLTIHPGVRSLCSSNVVGNSKFPQISGRNSATPAGMYSMGNGIYGNYAYGDYSPGISEYDIPPKSEKNYYYYNGEAVQPNSPLELNAGMFYPESMVNFPLSNIKKYQGDNVEYQQSSVKPEEYALHDMSLDDMLVVGAQLLPKLQTPEIKLPDAEYPLQPVTKADSYSSSRSNFPSVRASSENSNQPDSQYDYKKLYQIPPIYNTYPSEGVLLPQRIQISNPYPSIPYSASPLPLEQTVSNPWLGDAISDHEFVNGQYVKWSRGADDGYDNRRVNQPIRYADLCQGQYQLYPSSVYRSDPTKINY